MERPEELASVLLRKAWTRLMRSTAWWTAPLAEQPAWSGAWSPHVRWDGASDLDDPHLGGTLIVGPTTYLWDADQYTVLGHHRGVDRFRARHIGRRWLACPTEVYLTNGGTLDAARRELRDQVVTDLFHGRGADFDRASYLHRDADGSLWLTSDQFMVQRARLDVSDPARPRLTGYGNHLGPLASIEYGSPDDVRLGPGGVPDPDQQGVVHLDELTRLAGGPEALQRPLVEIHPPDLEDDPYWTVSGDRILGALDASTGRAVEKIVRAHLRREDPDLLSRVDFDSYAEEFCAFTRDEATARALAHVVIGLAPR